MAPGAGPTGARVDHFQVEVSLNNQDLGVWDTKEGGETDSEETRYRPGGLPEESLGGATTVTQITLSRMFRRGRDDDQIADMRSAVGSGQVSIKVMNTDADGNPISTGEVYTGVLKRVGPPEVDSNSSDVAMIEIEVTPNAAVSSPSANPLP